MITRKIKDIDTLIDSLPSEASTKRLQDAALESMNAENEKQGDELQRFVNEADQLLSQISDTLADIADTQLDARRLTVQNIRERQQKKETVFEDQKPFVI